MDERARGEQKLAWAARHMPLAARLERELAAEGSLAGQRVAVVLHLEAKTARLALLLHGAGAEVAVAGSNPLSTQDDVAEALRARGVKVHAHHGCTSAEYRAYLHRVADLRPTLVIDDGGDLVTLLHEERPEVAAGVVGGAEETTTGLRRARALHAAGRLRFPMLAVNDARMKHLFDNRYGTGQSVWTAIMHTTNLSVAGKTVVVAGYGWCGKGVALRARGLGARVIVTEVDPVAASEALMEGYQVLPMEEAASLGEIFVTVTGMRGVLGAAHFARMRDGAILCNAGHFDVEVDVRALADMATARRPVRPGVEEFLLADGRRLYLLAAGRLVNLAAGDGHPVEIMDLSFALQALALRYLVRHPDLPPGVWPLPPDVDREVAEAYLGARGVRIDRLTPEQQAYLAAWEEGTAG